MCWSQIFIQASRGNGEATLKVSARSLENSRYGNEYSNGKSRVAEMWTCNLWKFTDFQYVLAARKLPVPGCNFTKRKPKFFLASSCVQFWATSWDNGLMIMVSIKQDVYQKCYFSNHKVQIKDFQFFFKLTMTKTFFSLHTVTQG